MCLPDCKDCREKARQRRQVLTNVLLGAFLGTFLASLYVMAAFNDTALFAFGGVVSAGLLACAVGCERS